MNIVDRKNWQAKTEKLNKNLRLKVGMEVVDLDGNSGIVVKIRDPLDDIDNHGSVSVWQMDRREYGSDNCEHYGYEGWKSFLRVKMDLKHIVDLSKDCYFFDDTGRTPYIYKLKEIIDIHGDLCIVTAEAVATDLEIPKETLVFNLVTGKILEDSLRFWEVTDNAERVEVFLVTNKEKKNKIPNL